MRNSRWIILAAAGGLCLLSAAEGPGRRPVTTGSLFEEMVDLAALTRFPDPAFRTVQFSSFDRRSRIPGGPGWFANSDGFGGEPIPNFEAVLRAPDASGVGEYLIADVPGPGAVVRLWTAAISGKVRLYVDDLKHPLYEGDAEPFFRSPYDVIPGIEGSFPDRFRATVYQRDASYAPIPFAGRLKLVWIGKLDDIHFYQVQVRRYDPGTPVVTFRPGDIAKYRETIEGVTAALADPDDPTARAPANPARSFDVLLEAGAGREVLVLEGPGALRTLTLKVRADDPDRGLRQTVLRIVCDDFPSGQVEAPVGDFFGAAPGVNPLQSLPFTVAEDGRMTCRFVMPFAASLRVILENRGERPVRVEGEAVPMDYAWDGRSLHFRARWRVDHELVASNEEVQDLPFLLARGKGVYVGTTSLLMNPAAVPTPWGGWWGEGDEKAFVDGDRFPSIFGTGSEDFYNYSWSSPDIFFHPYCGQPRNDGPGNRGFVANFRWHILDPITFTNSLAFFMELNSHERTPGLSYARIGYYYARPGTIDDHQAIMPEDLREPRLPESWRPAARFGARNSVFHSAEAVMADQGDTTLEPGRLWEGGQLLVWKPRHAGDRKVLRIPLDTPGKIQIHLTAALTPRAGRLAVWLDGARLSAAAGASTIDLHERFRTLLRDFPLKPVELAAGEHTLIVEFEAAGPEVTAPEIGLDFIWVQKLD